MGEATPRLQLPYIIPGQAQKETAHNEALTRIDAILCAAVESARDTPPESPAEGQSWIVGAAPSGSWATKQNMLAAWTEGGWRFIAPINRMAVWNRELGYWIHWLGLAWSQGEHPVGSLTVSGKKVIGERQPAVPSPSGGTIIDQEARAAIAALTATLKSHGLTD